MFSQEILSLPKAIDTRFQFGQLSEYKISEKNIQKRNKNTKIRIKVWLYYGRNKMKVTIVGYEERTFPHIC